MKFIFVIFSKIIKMKLIKYYIYKKKYSNKYEENILFFGVFSYFIKQ